MGERQRECGHDGDWRSRIQSVNQTKDNQIAVVGGLKAPGDSIRQNDPDRIPIYLNVLRKFRQLVKFGDELVVSTEKVK